MEKEKGLAYLYCCVSLEISLYKFIFLEMYLNVNRSKHIYIISSWRESLFVCLEMSYVTEGNLIILLVILYFVCFTVILTLMF